MLQGTTIDELISLVERAEAHARQVQLEEEPLVTELYTPRFVYQVPQSQPVMFGVA